jgi:hypothetical protein
MVLPKEGGLTKSDELKSVLEDIELIGDIQASSIVSKDGLMMVSDCTGNVDANLIGAMVAMLIRSAGHVVEELQKGGVEYLLLHTESGDILIMNVCSGAILCVVTDKYENLGLTIVGMKKASDKIKNILGG